MSYELEQDATEALKRAFRLHASGVSVITMLGEKNSPVGFTATSMTSLGATPPLASFNVARGSSTWPALDKAEYVAIHTLSQQNLALAQKMAADHTKRFLDDDWTPGPYGLPIFKDATAVVIAKVREKHSVELNAVVIVDVIEGLIGQEVAALIYHGRQYKAVGQSLL